MNMLLDPIERGPLVSYVMYYLNRPTYADATWSLKGKLSHNGINLKMLSSHSKNRSMHINRKQCFTYVPLCTPKQKALGLSWEMPSSQQTVCLVMRKKNVYTNILYRYLHLYHIHQHIDCTVLCTVHCALHCTYAIYHIAS